RRRTRPGRTRARRSPQGRPRRNPRRVRAGRKGPGAGASGGGAAARMPPASPRAARPAIGRRKGPTRPGSPARRPRPSGAASGGPSGGCGPGCPGRPVRPPRPPRDGMGTLCVCGAPIGNLEDASYRLLRTRREASVIAAEDTRHARKLLGRYDIHTPLISLHEHNEEARIAEVLRRLGRGEAVALVSDAGLRAVADPGPPAPGAGIAAGGLAPDRHGRPRRA